MYTVPSAREISLKSLLMNTKSKKKANKMFEIFTSQ